jgi:hypothetical protein
LLMRPQWFPQDLLVLLELLFEIFVHQPCRMPNNPGVISQLEKGILLVNLDVPMDYSNIPELPWQAQMLETLVLMLLPVHTHHQFRIYVE